MNFDAFTAKYNGKAIDYDGYYGAQCVDLVAQYCVENSKPVAYANAKDWWNSSRLAGAFDFVVNNPNDYKQVPKRGDIVVWNGSLPNSGGYGHIAVFDAVVSPGVFRSFDQNWGGMYCHFVTHNWNYIIGWITPKAPATSQGDKPMTPQEENTAYQIVLERSMEHSGSGRTGYKFILDANAELNVKRAAIKALQAELQKTINSLNAKVTELASDDARDEQSIKDGLAQIASLTSQLETASDKIKDLEANPDTKLLDETGNIFTRLLARIFKKG